MMGPAVGQQDRLFYEFNLDERVPVNHLLRRIDAVLDLSWLRGELKPYYSHTGCPSVDPELMIRMLLVGYCYSIRSERRLWVPVEGFLVGLRQAGCGSGDYYQSGVVGYLNINIGGRPNQILHLIVVAL